MKTKLIILIAACFAGAALHAQSPTPTPSAAPSGLIGAFTPPPPPSLGDKQAQANAQITQQMIMGDRTVLQNYRTLYNSVWHSSLGLTPQQVCDALGTKAANLFGIARAMSTALASIDPDGLGSMASVPPGYSVATDGFGRAVVTYTALTTPTPTPAP